MTGEPGIRGPGMGNLIGLFSGRGLLPLVENHSTGMRQRRRRNASRNAACSRCGRVGTRASRNAGPAARPGAHRYPLRTPWTTRPASGSMGVNSSCRQGVNSGCHLLAIAIDLIGIPYWIRTGVAAMRGRCPGPLDCVGSGVRFIRWMGGGLVRTTGESFLRRPDPRAGCSSPRAPRGATSAPSY
jgi:hypothetical protein